MGNPTTKKWKLNECNFKKGKMMFRNKDGSKFINEQNEMFLKELRAIYENKKF